MTDILPNPDDDVLPEIELTQWREGRTLSADDISILMRALKEWDDERNENVDLYHQARQQVLFELGGQELVNVVNQRDEEMSSRAIANALARFHRKRADELAKRNASAN